MKPIAVISITAMYSVPFATGYSPLDEVIHATGGMGTTTATKATALSLPDMKTVATVAMVG